MFAAYLLLKYVLKRMQLTINIDGCSLADDLRAFLQCFYLSAKSRCLPLSLRRHLRLKRGWPTVIVELGDRVDIY